MKSQLALLGVACVMSTLLACCGTGSEPPKSVQDAALEKAFPTMITYTVTNNYTRQSRDETFHVYEFDVTFKNNYLRAEDKSEKTIGFVKRGNSWYWRDWGKNE